MKIVLLTSHVWKSKRKAGFHWIAAGFVNLGHDVTFVTCYSMIERIRKDYRNDIIDFNKLNKVIVNNDGIKEFVSYSIWRPFAINKLVDYVTAPFFRFYGKTISNSFKSVIINADVIVFESIYDVMKISLARRLNPKAKYIYRVSDDMDVLNFHKVCKQAEKNDAKYFDYISSPNNSIAAKFLTHHNSSMDPHGFPKHLYDIHHKDPYDRRSKNCVFVGNSCFDYNFLDVASNKFPRIKFHIIGPIPRKIVRQNIIFYGELAFYDTIKYIKYAHFAISPRTEPSLGDSNKIKQYVYCGLPIIMSSINKSTTQGIVYYNINDEHSIQIAIESVINMEKINYQNGECWTWDDLAKKLIVSIGGASE